ncbi:CU044_5270 family protein [Micromonospora sp. CPCC 206061]|uniref:CU044_5270 family protein n=1 Tax=Micromonospora sp. CPCC 206061 TaxID=3122410 RepID=UPI002FF3FB2D
MNEMDDINLIRTVLVEEVDDDHRDVARAKLLEAVAMDGVPARRPRKSTLRWSLVGAGTGLVAAAAAAVVALGSGPVAPTGPPSGRQVEAVAPANAQEFLLAAATQAERAPATSGKYWHVRSVRHSGQETLPPFRAGEKESEPGIMVVEQWQAANARQPSWWGVGELRDGRFEPRLDRVKHVGYGWEEEFSPAEIRNLPTDPAALRGVLEAKRKKNATQPGPTGDDYLFAATVGLLARAPATPAQTAAAYRLLAMLPRVELAGTATDSEGRTGMLVRRPAPVPTSPAPPTLAQRLEDVELIVDQQTYQVLAVTKNHRMTVGGKLAQTLWSQSVYTHREWTDQEPTMPTPPPGTPTK